MIVVEGAKHMHDLFLKPHMVEWETGVGPGYDFLFKLFFESWFIHCPVIHPISR